MPNFSYDNIDFHFEQRGGESSSALPFVFIHGIGGDHSQPLRFFNVDSAGTPSPDKRLERFQREVRLLSIDLRAHGRTRPLGDPAKLNFDQFSDDVIALLDHTGINKAVVGGISMGAGVSVNLALRYPERASALVLSRPAWLDGPMTAEAVEAYKTIAELLASERTAEQALEEFLQSQAFKRVNEAWEDAGKGLAGQIRGLIAEPEMRPAAIERLTRLPLERPLKRLQDCERISQPTLVLAAGNDPIHPLAFGEKLAGAIPGSKFHQLAPKLPDDRPHLVEVSFVVADFLEAHCLTPVH